MASRKAWKAELARLARGLSRDEVHADSAGPASVRYFYCTGVMGVVRLLRKLTRAKDMQAQHDVPRYYSPGTFSGRGRGSKHAVASTGWTSSQMAGTASSRSRRWWT